MLKKLYLFSLFNPNFTNRLFSRTSPRRATHQGTRNMAGSSAADIIAMSEDLDINNGGGRRDGQASRGRGRSRGGRGGRGGGRGGGGKGEMNREVAVSKALSKLLRHAAEDAGLTLDGEGFARVDQVVSLLAFHLPEEIQVSREKGIRSHITCLHLKPHT
jgi:hypothetical protein